jgi:hypothetical protein
VNPYRRRPPGGRSPHDRTNGIRHSAHGAVQTPQRPMSQDENMQYLPTVRMCIADNILVAQACTRALHTGA